jgi:CYTH domain-containing protein
MEIERKFRLAEAPPWLGDCPADEIALGYLCVDDESEVRLRRRGSDRRLTVKRGRGERREEIEIELSGGQLEALWPAPDGSRLSKRRPLVALDDGLNAEVDVYAGELEGLVVGEVEFDSEERDRDFQPPAWLGEEVTGDLRYANQSLAIENRIPED